jgi:2-polyprenyl-3-methyl-5-hydroxy-6-metoxy-1,4-benzoquinol methylase
VLKNDEAFWNPDGAEGAARLSWGDSGGDVEALRAHAGERWAETLRYLGAAGVPRPAGRVIEFGAGMGWLDDHLGPDVTRIVMLDHTDRYLAARPRPLSARCRHVTWSHAAVERLRAEEAPFDWLVAIAVFYHLDTATAAALILELGALLAPGGHVLVRGWRTADRETVRALAVRDRLFTRYPSYPLELDLLRETLAPGFEERCREGVLVYRRTAG